MWGSRSLRHLARVRVSNVDKKSVEGERPVRLCNYTDVYYNDCIDQSIEFMRATAKPAQVVAFQIMEGDTLITKDSETAADIGVATYVAESLPGVLCGYHLAMVRPTSDIDSRFLSWALRSDYVRGQWTVSASGVTRFGLTYGAIKNAQIPVPPLEEQRRIADFLDDQVGRIQRVTALRESQVQALKDRRQSVLDDLLGTANAPWVELRRLRTRVTTGPFGTVFSAGDYVDGGVPMINPTHINDGRIYPDMSHTVSLETATRLDRHRLRSGDIITGRKGDLGRSAMVSECEDGFICGSDAIAVHPDPVHLLPQFLDMCLHSGRLRESLVAQSPGATMPSLNEGMLLSVKVPHLSLGDQAEMVERISRIESIATNLLTQVGVSRLLLEERKGALITAAVRGEMDVTSASGRASEIVLASAGGSR